MPALLAGRLVVASALLAAGYGAPVHQVVQIAGALLILAAFAAAQFGVFSAWSWTYVWLNLIGSFVLAVDAWREEQWGFFLLEGVWALISAWGLVARATGRQAPAAH